MKNGCLGVHFVVCTSDHIYLQKFPVKMNAEKFEYQAKTLLFKDNNNDLAGEANTLRKLTALNFYASATIKDDNRFTCDLLKKDLESYSMIVDDPKGVNNYVKEVLDVLPNSLSGNQKQWKSTLTTESVAKLLKPLPCSEGVLDPWEKLNCVKAKLTVSDIKKIHQARALYKNGDSSAIKAAEVEERRKVPQNLFAQPKTSSKVIHPNLPVPSLQPKIGATNKPVAKTEENQPGYSKAGAFKTAKEELKHQNLKKYGKEGAKDCQYNYGSSKKSLGARKGGGIYGKFQPPIIRDEGSTAEMRREPNNTDSEGCEVDERLKNIDPKMIEIIQNEIIDSGPKLTWNDIAGLEFAKNTIQEVVVWPMLRPDIFTGLRRPPRGILLFGPPGTGKTLIGKCIASQSGATFLSISASSLTSKWVGDGEKMVRALFAVARVNQPAVVFIDEIDSLLSQRSDTEHESSRRIKTEFLVQLDGVGTGDEDRILIIGATNRPQELDEAARRRLVKRLYIPLPETNARAEIVSSLISNERHTLTESDVRHIAELTEGFSGADMKHVCQEASLGPIRSIPPMQICNIDTSQVRPVNVADFKSALTRVKSTVSPDDLHSYLAWDKQFGCGSI